MIFVVVFSFFLFLYFFFFFFFFQAEDGIRDKLVTGVQTCALPIFTAAWVGRSFPVLLHDRRRLVQDTRDCLSDTGVQPACEVWVARQRSRDDPLGVSEGRQHFGDGLHIALLDEVAEVLAQLRPEGCVDFVTREAIEGPSRRHPLLELNLVLGGERESTDFGGVAAIESLDAVFGLARAAQGREEAAGRATIWVAPQCLPAHE